MKGVEPLVGAVLIVAISISAIVLAIQLSSQAKERGMENLVYEEGKSNLFVIDSYIKETVTEGVGSNRLLNMHVTDGEYFVFPDNDTIYFVMESKAQIVGVGVSKMEDMINITGYPNKIIMFISYDELDIRTKSQFGQGSWEIHIKSLGWDPSTQKNVVNITV